MASNDPLLDALLDRLAAGWSALGASLGDPPDPTLVDPEALLAMTAHHGDAEPRLHELALDWCAARGSLINSARLRTVATEIAGDAAEVGGPRWPFLVGLPAARQSRGKTRIGSIDMPGGLWIRLRALFGVAARADILALLASNQSAALSLAELAARTRTTKRNVAIAVESLALGGAVEVDLVGNAKRVRLSPDPDLRAWLGAPPADVDWATRFAIVEALLRFDAAAIASPLARAVEARVLVERLLPLCRRTAWPLPDLRARGEAFLGAYDLWRAEVTAALSP